MFWDAAGTPEILAEDSPRPQITGSRKTISAGCKMSRYNYIIAGAGCSGLSLLVRMLASKKLAGKKILLIDKAAKDVNDRTWCFWEKGEGYFDKIVHRSWSSLHVFSHLHSQTSDISPYRYKMIRGIDFYNYCFDIIRTHTNVTILQEEIESHGSHPDKAFVRTTSGTFTADYLFSSIPLPVPSLSTGYYHLLQHFKGFIIQSVDKAFDPEIATLMDFRVSQEKGTSFVYMLPLSTHEALVEFTMFSGEVLARDEYDRVIQDYITRILQISSYEILSTEYGVIPMTNYRAAPFQGRVIKIGTAGGQTKPSTGYTFNFIQKHAEVMVGRLEAGSFPGIKRSLNTRKFDWYDSILLNILHNKKIPGAAIFTDLFRKNKIPDVFKFLDNETSLWEDLKIIKVLPKRVFAKAALECSADILVR
jgi:lycopene beta-cyclase